MLVRAATASVLSRLVEKINKAQKKDGSLTELQECPYKGTTYFRRVEPNQTNYYYIRGPGIAVHGPGGHAAAGARRGPQAAADAEPTLARRLREIGADRAVLALWLNPRAFDASLEAKAAKAEGADAALQKKVLAYWKAADGLAAWVTLDTELHLSLAVRVRPDELPPAARRLFAAASRPSELWRDFPDDALRGLRRPDRRRPPWWTRCRSSAEATTPARNSFLRQGLFKDVLSQVGPDWGLCVTAPPTGRRGLDCRRRSLAVRVVPGDEAAPVDEALLSAVHTAALLERPRLQPRPPRGDRCGSSQWNTSSGDPLYRR